VISCEKNAAFFSKIGVKNLQGKKNAAKFAGLKSAYTLNRLSDYSIAKSIVPFKSLVPWLL
jgi:hypothetical protein